MGDVQIDIEPDPEPVDTTVVVVEPPTNATDPLLDIVTRLTRCEDAITVTATGLEDVSMRLGIVESNVEYVERQQAVTDAAIVEVVDIVTEVATETDEPTPDPSPVEQAPESKTHRWWNGSHKR